MFIRLHFDNLDVEVVGYPGEVAHEVVRVREGVVVGGEEPDVLHQAGREQEHLVPRQQLPHAVPLSKAKWNHTLILDKP